MQFGGCNCPTWLGGDFEWYVQLGEECVEMHKDHNQHLVVLGQLVAAQIWCLDGLSHGGT